MLLRTLTMCVLLALPDSTAEGSAQPPEPPPAYLEIVVYRCGTVTEIGVGVELWGPNWHYIEHIITCSKI